jgi:FtsZ-binding cell division protein ZapB
MLLFINLKKEFKMLRTLLFIPMFLLTFSMANMENQIAYEHNIDRGENLILKLKLEIYELREKNSQLQKVIARLSSEPKEEQRRANAIAQLKKDLRMSRKTKVQPIMLLR